MNDRNSHDDNEKLNNADNLNEKRAGTRPAPTGKKMDDWRYYWGI